SMHAVVLTSQAREHQAAQYYSGQNEDHYKNENLDAATDYQLFLQPGVTFGQRVIDTDCAQYIAFLALVAAVAIYALIIRPGYDGFDQRIDTALVVTGIVFNPFSGQRLHIQGFTALLLGTARTEHGVQLIAADNPNIQHVVRGHDFLTEHVPIADGAGHHHGVQTVEKRFCQAINVLVAVLLQMSPLGLGAVDHSENQDHGEGGGKCGQ